MSHFKEVLSTLGATNVKVLRDNTKWGMWEAEYRTPVSSVIGYYLYLKHKCPLKEATARNISSWQSLCKNNTYEIIVTPKSDLSEDLENTQKVFKGSNARTSKQLLVNSFLGGIKWKPISTEAYFVEPSLEVKGNETVRDSLNFLQEWLTNDLSSGYNSGLALLSADGGVGKTTISRILCERIHRKNPNVFPILIESDQWKHLIESTVTLDALWDLAISKRFEKANRLLSNEVALRALIQEGVFVIIFDGFDELCAAGHTPKEIIDELNGMVSTGDGSYNARILITARETFWSSISDEVDEDIIDVFHLRGFDNAQRKKFFKGRLNNQVERDLAFRMTKEISGAIYPSIEKEDLNEDRPSGVPFVLSLIASYVEDNPDAKNHIYSGDPLEGLLLDICKRENKRQQFNIDPEDQMVLFEELFREFQNEFKLGDLKTYLEVICDVTEAKDIKQFSQHAFIEHKSGDVYGPRYEVLRVYFVARFLANSISDLSKKTQRKAVARLLARQSTGKTQVLDWLLIQLNKLPEKYLLESIHHAKEIINDPQIKESRKEASMALFFVVMSLLTEKEKTERTKRLKVFLSPNKDELTISNVVFSGLIKGFDFSNITFHKCSFIDAEFKSCKFNQKTVFSLCVFDGVLSIGWCDGEADVKLEHCMYSKESEFKWDTVRKVGTNEKVRRAFAEEVLERALRKFKGGLGYKGIQKRHSNTGFRKGNPYVDDIWGGLIKHKIIESHSIAGVDQGGYHLFDDKSMRREITQFLDNGILSKRLEAVIHDIMM